MADKQVHNNVRYQDIAGDGSLGFAMYAAEANARFTLRAQGLSAATAETNISDTAVAGLGGFKQATILLVVSATATEAGDTLDVYIDTSPDGGTTWINVIHFPQLLGTTGAKKYWAVLDPAGSPPTTCTDVTADAAANTVRPSMYCDQFRVRRTTVDVATLGNLGFNFGVFAFMKS